MRRCWRCICCCRRVSGEYTSFCNWSELALRVVEVLNGIHSRTATEQVELLRKTENRQIIQKVADDTVTLRTRSLYSASASRADSVSITRGQPSVGATEFEFDDAVLNSLAYQRAIQHQHSQSHSHSHSHPQRTERHSIASSRANLSALDEGFGAGVMMDTPVSSPNPHESVALNIGRKFSGKSTRQQTQGNQRSDSAYSSLGSRSSGSRRDRIRSMLRRFSTSGPSSPATSPIADSPNGRRSRSRDFNTSIDLKTVEGSSAPLIVKVAQTGSRAEMEHLIQSSHDIEARHIHSRRNALLVAAHCGNEEVVDLLIQNNARLEVTDGSGCTALHLAAARGHVEVLELLLYEGVDVEARNTHGRTAIWMAADQGQLDATRMLVATQAKVNSRADNQMTPLHVAAKRGDADIVEFLISHGADLEAKDASMMTALHYACEAGHIGVIELLLNSKTDVNAPGSDRRSPLICAAAMGRFPVVQLLLNKKASSRSIDDAGMTALHWAAFNGHAEIVHLLSQKKGSLSMTNVAGRTALHLAVMNAQFGVIELLLRRDDVFLEARCESGLTMLHYACIADSPEIARLLLVTGCDIEAQTHGDQRRPVHIAAVRGSTGLLNLLCDKGASLEARDANGDRALCVACRQGRPAAVQNLLQRGSPLYQRLGTRLHEDSPLCLAAMGGHVPVVSILLQHGASVHRGDETGWQPARYAAYYGHPEVLQLLLANGTHIPADRIGFAPHATISGDRRERVRQLLRDARRQQTTSSSPRNPGPFSSRPQAVSPFEPETNNIPHNNAGPHELPSTLEQGLPASRSHTPDQMRRGTTHVVGSDELQNAWPTAFEPQSTLIQQPRAVNASVEPWVDRMQNQVVTEPESSSRQADTGASALPVSLTQNLLLLQNQASGANDNNDDNDEKRSETSSVSVYTAPEEGDVRPGPETIHELPAW